MTLSISVLRPRDERRCDRNAAGTGDAARMQVDGGECCTGLGPDEKRRSRDQIPIVVIRHSISGAGRIGRDWDSKENCGAVTGAVMMRVV